MIPIRQPLMRTIPRQIKFPFKAVRRISQLRHPSLGLLHENIHQLHSSPIVFIVIISTVVVIVVVESR